MKRWPTKPLEEIADLLGGSTPSRDNPGFWNGNIHWVTPTDLPMPDEGISIVSRTKDRITQAGLDNSSANVVPKGTVLFSSRATIGKVAVADMPLTTNQGFANFVPRPEIGSRFLAYSLWHRREDIARLSGSTTFKEVSRSTLRKYRIPVPPLAEQERIVKLLDEADELRKLRAQADRRTAQLIPALFHVMFGDPATNPQQLPIVCLGDVCEANPNYGTMIPARANAGEWLALRVANIQDGSLSLTNRKFVDLPKENLGRHTVRDGDLLLARAIGSEDHLGKCVVVFPGKQKWAFDSHLMRVRLNRVRCEPVWLKTLLDTPGGRRLFLNKTRQSAVQFNINSKEFVSISVPLPPLPLQKEFAARVAEIREMESAQAASRQRLEALFQSLLHRAFNGEL